MKFRTLEPPSGYKRNYVLMKFHTSVYLEVLKEFLKSFGGAVGKFPLDRENGPLLFYDSKEEYIISLDSRPNTRPREPIHPYPMKGQLIETRPVSASAFGGSPFWVVKLLVFIFFSLIRWV